MSGTDPTARSSEPHRLEPTPPLASPPSSPSFLRQLFVCPQGVSYFWNLLYLIDWILVIVFGSLSYFPFHATNPRTRYLPSNWASDPIYNFPLTEPETFRTWTLILPFILLIPLCLFFLIFMRSLLDVHHAFISMTFGFALSLFLSEFGKVLVGMYRPNFVKQCNPLNMTSGTSGTSGGAVVCLNADEMDSGAARSFPSGHALHAFAGWGMMTLYLLGKCRVFASAAPVNIRLMKKALKKYEKTRGGYQLVDDEKSKTFVVPSPSEHFLSGGVELWKALICFLPVIMAYFIALSRVMDYVHRPVDIVMGAFLGTIVAFFSYHVYYPSLFSQFSHVPKNRYARFVMQKEKCSWSAVLKILFSMEDLQQHNQDEEEEDERSSDKDLREEEQLLDGIVIEVKEAESPLDPVTVILSSPGVLSDSVIDTIVGRHVPEGKEVNIEVHEEI